MDVAMEEAPREDDPRQGIEARYPARGAPDEHVAAETDHERRGPRAARVNVEAASSMMHCKAQKDQAGKDDRQGSAIERVEARGHDREQEDEGIENGVLVLADEVAAEPARWTDGGETAPGKAPADRGEAREEIRLKVVAEEQPGAEAPAARCHQRDEHAAPKSVRELGQPARGSFRDRWPIGVDLRPARGFPR